MPVAHTASKMECVRGLSRGFGYLARKCHHRSLLIHTFEVILDVGHEIIIIFGAHLLNTRRGGK